MENASKALLIAGGLLLTMLVVSLLVLMNGNINKMASAQSDKQAAEQLTAFNSGYEAYNKQYLKGTDIITVVNKAIQDNNKYNYGITIQITLIKQYDNGNSVYIGQGQVNWSALQQFMQNANYSSTNSSSNTADSCVAFQKAVFSCPPNGVTYTNGRVSSITFIQYNTGTTNQ